MGSNGMSTSKKHTVPQEIFQVLRLGNNEDDCREPVQETRRSRSRVRAPRVQNRTPIQTVPTPSATYVLPSVTPASPLLQSHIGRNDVQQNLVRRSTPSSNVHTLSTLRAVRDIHILITHNHSSENKIMSIFAGIPSKNASSTTSCPITSERTLIYISRKKTLQ